MEDYPWPQDVDDLDVDEVWWPACYWPRVVQPDYDGDTAPSPTPGVTFKEYLENMGVMQKDGGVAQDGEDTARNLLKRSFRRSSTREQIRSLAAVLEDWAEKPDMGMEKLVRGWDIFMGKKIDTWGVFITPHNVADVFEAWLREETKIN